MSASNSPQTQVVHDTTVPPLAVAVRDRVRQRGITMKAAAREMGLTYSHLMALCSGARRFGGVRRDRMMRIATFLEVPVITCYLLGGEFSSSDFVVEQSLTGRLALTLAKLRADPEWSALAPSEAAWESWPEPARTLVALLYERGCQEDLRRALRGAT